MPRGRPADEHRCTACPGESSSDSWRIRSDGPALEPATVRSDEAESAKCPSARGKRRCLEPGIRESAGYARRRRHLLSLLSLSFPRDHQAAARRSEEHTSELQSLMRISSAVFCLKKKTP